MEMKKLNSNWKMRAMSESDYVEAVVPGSIYADYERNKKMENPYYRDNEMKALELMKEDFEYKTSFMVEAVCLKKKKSFCILMELIP